MSNAAKFETPGVGDDGKSYRYNEGGDAHDLVDLYYAHTQGTPSTTWTINHNLGWWPTVETFTVGGLQTFGAIAHTSLNQTVVTFNTSQAGSARLI